jgi:hypothetical protein
MPLVESLSKACMGGQSGVCTDRARFHLNLASFRKTNLTQDELRLFSMKNQKHLAKDELPYTPNPIFLYDTAQLGDKDEDRVSNFRRDVMDYLGLGEDLPPTLHISPGHGLNETEQARRDSKKIHICDDKFAEQRKELVATGKEMRDWVLMYFTQSPDVVVSNPEHFQEIMETYARDPCNDNGTIPETRQLPTSNAEAKERAMKNKQS